MYPKCDELTPIKLDETDEFFTPVSRSRNFENNLLQRRAKHFAGKTTCGYHNFFTRFLDE